MVHIAFRDVSVAEITIEPESRKCVVVEIVHVDEFLPDQL
jgi:hypothetical protein